MPGIGPGWKNCRMAQLFRSLVPLLTVGPTYFPDCSIVNTSSSVVFFELAEHAEFVELVGEGMDGVSLIAIGFTTATITFGAVYGFEIVGVLSSLSPEEEVVMQAPGAFGKKRTNDPKNLCCRDWDGSLLDVLERRSGDEDGAAGEAGSEKPALFCVSREDGGVRYERGALRGGDKRK